MDIILTSYIIDFVFHLDFYHECSNFIKYIIIINCYNNLQLFINFEYLH